MSATWGSKFRITVFGESHSAAIGVVLDGVPAGVKLDTDAIAAQMARRAPGTDSLSTPRKEADIPEIVCGVLDGVTEGTPIAAFIRNANTKSSDYEQLKRLMRPGHSDYGYFRRYGGFNDVRGGGASSGRLTAALVFAGAVARQLLAERGITVGAHISSLGGVEDARFGTEISAESLAALGEERIPLLDGSRRDAMRAAVEEARADGDSVGGTVQCAVVGVKAGMGAPFFESVESVISSLAFSVPAVKAVAFGDGFALASMRGSGANDPMYYDGSEVKTRTNRNGGVIGGVTNGMPIVFEVAIKPTASVFKPQNTVDIKEKKDAVLTLKGRHDPCIVVRAVPVIEAIAAIAVYDLLGR